MGLYTPPVTKLISKRITFTGAANLGAIGNCVLFTTTGGIHIVSIDAFVATSLTVDGGTGTATLALGVENGTADFVAATTATALVSTAPHWVSATPTADSIPQVAAQQDILISQDIVAAVINGGGNQIVNGGVMDFTVVWYPISTGASLVAA